MSYNRIADFIVAAATITQVFAVRLAVLTLAMPAFALRDIGRRAGRTGPARSAPRWGGRSPTICITPSAGSGRCSSPPGCSTCRCP